MFDLGYYKAIKWTYRNFYSKKQKEPTINDSFEIAGKMLLQIIRQLKITIKIFLN